MGFYNIKPLQEIKIIKVFVEPGIRDFFLNTLVLDYVLPAQFYMGKNWTLDHDCCACGNKIVTGESHQNYKILGYLSLQDIKDKGILDNIGRLFKLSIHAEVDINNFQIYSYLLIGKYKTLAQAAHYHCNICNSKYFLIYANLWGEGERNPSPDEVYIERILNVQYRENYLSSLF